MPIDANRRLISCRFCSNAISRHRSASIICAASRYRRLIRSYLSLIVSGVYRPSPYPLAVVAPIRPSLSPFFFDLVFFHSLLFLLLILFLMLS